MDRGIPTEEVLAQMRASDPPVQYLVGTPKGGSRPGAGPARQALADGPARGAGEAARRGQELYVFAESRDRIAKERAHAPAPAEVAVGAAQAAREHAQLTRETLLMKLGAARARRRPHGAWSASSSPPQGAPSAIGSIARSCGEVRRREGRYLLRTNLTESDPAKLWEYYLQLVAVEEAFKNLKGDLAIRPIFHREQRRIEAHIFIAFLAYCLHVTLGRRLKHLAPGLTPRSVLEKFAAVQMIDVHIPTTDGRELSSPATPSPKPS